MSRRPVIGVPTQNQPAMQGSLPPTWIMGHSYVKALTASGAVPWLIPLLDDDEDTLRQMYEQLDGLFLAGGVDMNPETYGEEVSDFCGRIDVARDRVEITLTRWALDEHKPVLGVCRGIQVMNVAAGGTLYQDVMAQRPKTIRHDYFPYTGEFARDEITHDVGVEAGSRLGKIVDAPRLSVNSMHHQGIKELAGAFRPAAYAADGLIEGMEAPNGHFAVGVQWHPEEFIGRDGATDRLFAAFMQAAVEFKN
ncbi:MAG: gamma-glutamyl-gamma-aminobutyrate hydrolase family protein [Caldilineales bacterium]|nr:gamma-glutamyl-gamma-aminobutyrate hydrolase family protein [Caldilineales bacterium]